MSSILGGGIHHWGTTYLGNQFQLLVVYFLSRMLDGLEKPYLR